MSCTSRAISLVSNSSSEHISIMEAWFPGWPCSLSGLCAPVLKSLWSSFQTQQAQRRGRNSIRAIHLYQGKGEIMTLATLILCSLEANSR